jgi:hypothetical protein
VAPRNFGTKQKQTCKGKFWFKASFCAYKKDQLSIKNKQKNESLNVNQMLKK